MKIVIRRGDEPWKVIEPEGYKNEGHLQQLIAEDPSLIPIVEMHKGLFPFSVAIQEFPLHGSGSLDILAFNRDGAIAVVECKLADNPEIRRKVIGQILEYAAFLNKLDYDQLDRVICQKMGRGLEELLEDKIDDPEWKDSGFQEAVERNLVEGRFTLIIVVDAMEETLRTTIEFLNACGLQNISLHALEMKHLSKDEIEILIPQVYGVGKDKEATDGQRKLWSEGEFFRQAHEKVDPQALSRIEELFRFTKEKADKLAWGTGKDTGSFTFQLVVGGRPMSVFNLFANGKIYISCGDIARKITDAKVIERFKQALRQVKALQDIDVEVARWPSFEISNLFRQDQDLDRFTQAILDLKREIGK